MAGGFGFPGTSVFMAEYRLISETREHVINQTVVTIGRTPENDISFPDDPNVSRFHAEVEPRGDEFCLIDLNSSNGTKVNGAPVTGEVYLTPGDRILLGGSTEIIFSSGTDVEAESAQGSSEPESTAATPPVSAAVGPAPALSTPTASSGSRSLLLIAAGTVMLALVVVGVAGVIYYRSTTSSCNATALILSPEPGSTIYEPTEIEIEVENSACVARVIFTLNGEEFASSDTPPFSVTIDPKDHPELADGHDHDLGIAIIDEDGRRLQQRDSIPLAMETRTIKKPEPEPGTTVPVGGPKPEQPGKKEVTLMQVQEMTNVLVKQFSGGHRYNVSNREFLAEVQKRTAEYAQDGFYERAARFRDPINVAFVRESNLDAPVGYILAMSRSRFDPQKQGSEEGLYRMKGDFVKANNYDGVCAGQTISEPSQACSARAAAMYMKALIHSVFDGDAVYAIAAFGKTTAEATEWKAKLPADRSDVWNSIKAGPEREQLVRFFAAALVAENPQRFGLMRDKPISTLYP
ncbi:MAG TPA: FHA domain-containing protein [Pyrinomonadaceae bacterium]|nr:FHA domain-containing protein [Pyrinomonadaceae bacterium]